MKQHIFITALMILISMSITACSDEKTSAPQPKIDADLTGERFFDSAASKFLAANPELSRAKANCMVESMIEGGVIGLGEVNSMNLDPTGLQENARLKNAYYSAKKKCT
jgi:hypothetical protein